MNAKILLFLAASLALAGCPDKPAEKPATPAPKVAAVPPPPSATATTTAAATATTKVTCPPDCAVKVTVTAPCTVVSADPEKLYVARGTPAIRFTIVGSPPGPFRFATNGIVFPDPQPPTNPAPPPPADPKGVFPSNEMSGGNTPVFVIKDIYDKDSAKGAWKYTINVTDGTASCKLDPYVIND